MLGCLIKHGELSLTNIRDHVAFKGNGELDAILKSLAEKGQITSRSPNTEKKGPDPTFIDINDKGRKAYKDFYGGK